jgi:hypothetical protein
VLKHALLTLARHEQSRDCLLLLESILETPGLMPRLLEVLRPMAAGPEEAETAADSRPGQAIKKTAEKGKTQATAARKAPATKRKAAKR